MNIYKKLACFVTLMALVGLNLLCNIAPSLADTNDEAITYDAATKTVTIQGDCDTDQISTTMSEVAAEAVTLHFAGTSTIATKQSTTGPFQGCSSLKYITADEDARVSFVGNGGANPTLKSFFYRCTSLLSLDGLSAWDVSKVSGKYCMFGIFQSCSSLVSLDGLSAWNVSSVSGDYCMNSMFYGCSSLTSLDGLSDWNVSNLNGKNCMASMFYECTELTSLDGLSAWDVSKVSGENCMFGTFQSCSSLVSLDGLSAWNVSSVSGTSCMYSMFYGCSSLTSLDGLSAWDVSRVSGDYCMYGMFYNCTSLTSLDGLSAWDTSNLSGKNCMNSMFYNCNSLASIDALQTWNIQKALSSIDGVKNMFTRTDGTTVSSLTVSSTFLLSDDMFKNRYGWLPTANWWPVNADSPSAIDMNNLVVASQNIAANGYRWQKCTDGSNNPTQPIASLDVNWPAETTSVYTGYFQNFTPTSVQGDSFTLEAGKDYYVTYQKQGEIEETSSIKDAGTYTATLNIRGKYIYTAGPVTKTVIISPLDLTSDTYDLVCYCEPNVYTYTGNPCTPKTMVKLHIGEDETPDHVGYQRYSYLPEKSDTEGRDGDYSVAYTNNIYPGTATAKVSPATQNLINETQATFRIKGVRVKVLLIAGAGYFSDGSSTKELSTTAGATLLQSDVETPVREGYTFVGWQDATGTTITFPYVVPSSNVSFTASWKESDTPVTQDGWHQSDTGWQYMVDGEYVTGWLWIDDDFGAHWYYFNQDTYMATNQWMWDEEHSSWYWLCSSGPMIQSLWQWIDNEWYGFWWNGKMCRGWVWDADWQAWFYCYNNGIMARSAWVGPYWLNWQGIWIR